MAKRDVIVGLDIGTTKITAVIAQLDGSGGITIIGVGSSPSDGLRRGVVVNLQKTVQSIENAARAAELMADVDITAAYVGIAGGHIRSINSRGVIAISKPDSGITRKDVARVIDAARAVSIPMDREVIHVIPQEYIVDDQAGIKHPIGMCGVRLEAEVHIVTAAVTSAQNICKSVRQSGIEVMDLVLEPLASSYAVLFDDEKELGVLLLDVGGGTTDVALFYEGSIRETAVIGFGGVNVTNDIALGLSTPIDEAERIKKQYGCALESMVHDDESISVAGIGGRPSREVPRKSLAGIVEPRMEEIYTLALRAFRRSDYADVLGAGGGGVVVTGGGALLHGSPELAERVFGMPARLGTPKGVVGLTEMVTNPMHATGIGLILYGVENCTKGRCLSGDVDDIESILKRMKEWFKHFWKPQ